MKQRLATLRIIVHATFSWCAGAIFAVVWLWLFFGVQLDRRQAWVLIAVFGVLGFAFGCLMAWRSRASPPG